MSLYILSAIQILSSVLLGFTFINGKSFATQFQKPFTKEELLLSLLTVISTISAIFYKAQILLITSLIIFYTLLIFTSVDKHSKFNTCTVFFANIIALVCIYSAIENVYLKVIIALLMSFQTSFYLKVSNIRLHILKNLVFVGLLLTITNSILKTASFCIVYAGLELFLSIYTKRIILIKNNNLIKIATRLCQFALILLIFDKGVF